MCRRCSSDLQDSAELLASQPIWKLPAGIDTTAPGVAVGGGMVGGGMVGGGMVGGGVVGGGVVGGGVVGGGTVGGAVVGGGVVGGGVVGGGLAVGPGVVPLLLTTSGRKTVAAACTL